MKKKIFIFISPSFFLIVLLFFYLLIIFKNNNVNISSKNDSETIATTDVQFEKYSDSVTAIGDYEYSCDYY
jgi:hypothetical protein